MQATSGFSFPSPMTSPLMLLRLGACSQLTHPCKSLVQELLSCLARWACSLGLLCCRHKVTVVHWPRHTPQPPTSESTRKPKPAPGSVIESPCPMGWLRGREKKGLSALDPSLLLFLRWPQPMLPTSGAQGRGAPQLRVANMLQRPGSSELVGIYRVFCYQN